VGFAIAYVLTPIVDAIALQGGVKRFVAAGFLFGVVSVAMVLVLGLVVPAVMREGATLIQRVFSGQPPAGGDHAGKGPSALPWRRSLIETGLAHMEDWQNNLKVKAHLAFDREELAFLDVVESRTAPLRSYQAAMLASASVCAPLDRWPNPPPVVTAAEASAVAAPSTAASWPSPDQSETEKAAKDLAPDERERWLGDMKAADTAMAGIIARLGQALEAARNGATGPEVDLIKQAWSSPASGTRADQVQLFADGLAAADRASVPGAHQVMVMLHGESAVGASALAALLGKFDEKLRGYFDTIPDRFGAWTSEGIASFDSWVVLVLDLVLVPIYAFFLVLAMPRIRRSARAYIPMRGRERTIRIIRDIELVVAAFFRGRLIICSLCAVCGWIGFSLIGWFSAVSMPYAALFGIAIGLATTVPLSGLLFLLPAIGLTMLQPGASAVHAALVLGVYVVVQALEAVLIPLIMGREVELHPVVLIVALLLCGRLLGVLGLVLAVPIAASCRILAREFLWPRLQAWADRPAPFAPAEASPPAGSGGPPA
jgi:predicted PurR-regulated permease PerM